MNELQPEAMAGKQVLQAQRGWWVGWALNRNMYKSGLERPLKPLKGSISAIPEDVTQSCTQDTYGNFGTHSFPALGLERVQAQGVKHNKAYPLRSW